MEPPNESFDSASSMVGQEARATNLVSLVVSPFPGLMHVIDVDASEANSLHSLIWPTVVGSICLLILLIFYGPLN